MLAKQLAAADPRLARATWGQGANAVASVRADEAALEAAVTQTLGAMSVLWLGINDAAGPGSQRGYVERNAIALLSNFDKPSVDPPSAAWLGHRCESAEVRAAGLWNVNHIGDVYDAEFIDRLEFFVDRQRGAH